MPLVKEICKKCIAQKIAETPDDNDFQPWDETDDEAWEKGKLSCGMSPTLLSSMQPLDVSEDVPEWCPYLTEHLVSQDVEQRDM